MAEETKQEGGQEQTEGGSEKKKRQLDYLGGEFVTACVSGGVTDVFFTIGLVGIPLFFLGAGGYLGVGIGGGILNALSVALGPLLEFAARWGLGKIGGFTESLLAAGLGLFFSTGIVHYVGVAIAVGSLFPKLNYMSSKVVLATFAILPLPLLTLGVVLAGLLESKVVRTTIDIVVTAVLTVATEGAALGARIAGKAALKQVAKKATTAEGRAAIRQAGAQAAERLATKEGRQAVAREMRKEAGRKLVEEGKERLAGGEEPEVFDRENLEFDRPIEALQEELLGAPSSEELIEEAPEEEERRAA